MAKIKKQYEKRYTVTDNQLIEDNRLSWKARGIFTYLWAQSDDWEFYEVEVTKHAPDGRDSLRTGLKELEKFGYLKRTIKRDKGRFNKYDWILSDTPMLDFPNSEKPNSGNPTLTSTKKTSTNNNNGGGEELENSLQVVINNFQKNIGLLNGKNINDLQVWTKDLPVDVINYAVDIAADNNAQTYSYVNSILKRWFQQNIKTLDQAKANSVKNKRQTPNKSNNKRGVESEEYGW
ncbi:DnaD domain protein [Fructilactobacillus sanfranciscensis]|uniref:DnaD domain protein n=1 Tax=Fructilactobacillus sanfranciscensis TaxID=1625 RepID=UPI000CD49596|nr:DnaD domain protein [Fructilactobacillus sanfranciscensis]POH18617.1 hypothetical protein BGL45_06660 [Fructilactobacillus sanfranciscensis]